MVKKKQSELFEDIKEEEVQEELKKEVSKELSPEEPDDNKSDLTPEVKIKKPRKKRVISEAQKEVLRNNLKRGRETALKNRQRKAQLNKIKKKKDLDDQEELILNDLQSRKQASKQRSELEQEITDLKNKLKSKVTVETNPKLEISNEKLPEIKEEEIEAYPESPPPAPKPKPITIPKRRKAKRFILNY